MRLAKKSTASLRNLKKKLYNFSYLNALVGLFVRKGFKLYAYKIIFMFSFLLKIKYSLDVDACFSLIFSKYVPLFSFLSKKIAANKYQLPWLINTDRAKYLLIKWFLNASFLRSENRVVFKLFYEFNDLYLGYGKTLKFLEDHYSLALKNRPFLRFLYKRRKVYLSRLKKYGVK